MPLLMCLVMCVVASGCSMAEPDRVGGPGQRSERAIQRDSRRQDVSGRRLDTRRVLDCLNSEAAGFWARTGADIGPQTFVLLRHSRLGRVPAAAGVGKLVPLCER